jgi:ferrous iron transport protein B
MSLTRKRKIALVGTPNAGKTALFNLLTHSHQRVANYSGVTVDSAEADLFLSAAGGRRGSRNLFKAREVEISPEAVGFASLFPDEIVSLVDLPGAYSLRPYTEDEGVLARALQKGDFDFDGMILVVDATQPERAIRFMIEVLNQTSMPAVVALNMWDLAEARGFDFDLQLLSQRLGVQVIPTVATKKQGMREIIQALTQVVGHGSTESAVIRNPGKFFSVEVLGAQAGLTRSEISNQILSFYKLADQFLKEVLNKRGAPDHKSDRIDRVILHPVWGMVILLLVLGITFQLMFNLAQFPMDLITNGFKAMGDFVNSLPINGVVKSFFADGVIAGVGGTLVFLPQILILFTLILFLEDFGFMARAVFLLDFWMGKVGLHGRAFLPLLSSHACAVPGIMSTRTIESKRDRIITTLIIPLTTCSARIPVYTLLISAFIPNRTVLLGVKLQGLVMLALYVIGIFSALLIGGVFRRFVFHGKRPPLLIEMPSYKMPSLMSLSKGLVYRGKLFLTRVGTIILALTVVIWVLVSFPRVQDTGTGEWKSSIDQSYAARAGHLIEPAIRPLGFDWKIGMALIPTFAAREVMVSTLSTVYAVQEQNEEVAKEKLSEMIKRQWSMATGLSLIAWFIFAPQCISTLATAKRELKSSFWMWVMLIYLFGLAYLASFLTFQIAK